ncbi:hypothetical protein ABG79_02378 [Caloramator mitchellensis]|uniref:Oligosaccharide repeat unit polymerase n=1 Tax=Caloramator mitchellensis TaxID=908809 RepID=A0A0R3JQW7_CALMK|nr:oligosaccharide repeat unit polymerase [Caloramator mitchellensis]KRQ85840.1 hypothetical protein ABG79_02378 [Caloramator mitchellensis]
MDNIVVVLFLIIVITYVNVLYKKRIYVSTFYWLAVFTLTFLIPNLGTILNAYGYSVSKITYNKLNFFYFLILTIFIAFNLLFNVLLFKNMHTKTKYGGLSYNRLSSVFKIYFILSLIIFIVIGLEGFRVGASKVIHGGNSIVSFFTPMIVFGLNLSSLIKFFYVESQIQKTTTIIHIIYSLLFGFIFTFARRQVLYPIIIAFIFSVIIYDKKPKLRYFILAIFLMIFIGLPLMISIRTNGFIMGISNYFTILTGDLNVLMAYLIMSTDVSWSYSLAAIIIESNVKLNWLTLLRPLTIILPRSIWVDKPLPASSQLVNILNISNDPNMSIPPGIVGESYIYFDIIGIIVIGMIWGIITALVDRKLYIKDPVYRKFNSTKILALITIIVQLITGSLRGDTPTTLQETQLVIIPFLILLYMSKYKIKI